MRSTKKQRVVLLFAAVAVLMLVFAAAQACGGSSTTTESVATTAGSTPTGAGGGAQVTIKGFAFDPQTVTIKVGETVTWTNEDPTNHPVAGDNGEFDSLELPQGASFSFTFTSAGTFTYHCKVHTNMKGTVVVE